MPNETPELTFFNNDPGAVKYGNFINYYTFHSPKERIDYLNLKMFPIEQSNEPIVCLDIGCNTGELTKELYLYLKAIYTSSDVIILAIDIDPTLIERAKESNENENIFFTTCNIMLNSGREILKKFRESYSKEKFDIIFCFSVTMWIHINNGDEGLIEFLQNLKLNSKVIVIEPQPWKCYKNALRRMKRSGKDFELFDSLNIRKDVDKTIESVLSEKSHYKVEESGSSSWNRKIQSYHLR